MTYNELLEGLRRMTPEQLEQAVLVCDWIAMKDWHEVGELRVADVDTQLGDDGPIIRQGMPVLSLDKGGGRRVRQCYEVTVIEVMSWCASLCVRANSSEEAKAAVLREYERDRHGEAFDFADGNTGFDSISVEPCDEDYDDEPEYEVVDGELVPTKE